MTHVELDAFLAVCRHKNITKAAQDLFITQSALSTRLKQLEDEIGCTLLIRHKGKREISLTSKGWDVYRLALQYQDILGKIKAVGASDSDSELRISAITSVGNYLLRPVFDRFMDEFPEICLSVDSFTAVEAVPKLLAGTLDLAFVTKKIESDQIAALPLISDPLVMLCAQDADYPETVSQSMLRMKDEVFVQWSSNLSYWHQTVFGTDITPFIKLQFMGQVGPTIAKPGKWGFVPKSMADCIRAELPVRQCETTFPLPDRTIYMLRRRDTSESTNIRRFLDTLREDFAQRSIPNRLL